MNAEGNEVCEQGGVKPENAGKPDKKRKINVNRTLFIVAGLILPILSFLVFWLYVNFNSYRDCRLTPFLLKRYMFILLAKLSFYFYRKTKGD